MDGKLQASAEAQEFQMFRASNNYKDGVTGWLLQEASNELQNEKKG